MSEKLTIDFKYKETEEKFAPISMEYDDVNHAILAFCLAEIIYLETHKKPCFAKHIKQHFDELVEENN